MLRIPIAVGAAGAALSLAGMAPSATGAVAFRPVASVSTTNSASCDLGAWIGPRGAGVNGRPQFDAGDSGAAYIWHDASGWHLRTTDAAAGAHRYTGTIVSSPGTAFAAVRPVRNERDDRVWITGGNVLHYDLTTYRGVDGFDFRVAGCHTPREHEALRFSLDYNGREEATSRIKLGSMKQHPPHATFYVRRSA